MDDAATDVRIYEPDDAMPDEYRELLRQLVMVQAGIEGTGLFTGFIINLGNRMFELAPTPADKVRVMHYIADETRHGFIYYNLGLQVGIDFSDPRIAEGAGAFLDIFNHLPETWADLGWFNFLGDRVGVYQGREWINSTYGPMRRSAAGVVNDEYGHSAMGHHHLKVLCETDEGRQQAQAALRTWYPRILDMFGRSDSKRDKSYIAYGLKEHTNEELRQMFISETSPMIEDLGLVLPDPREGRQFL
jgi:1,2-phenylacetyl-CoA epoxidase catalytic subunit